MTTKTADHPIQASADAAPIRGGAARIRAGAVALAIAGLLFFAYPAVRPWHDESNVNGATASMTSGAWVAAHFFAMIGFILMPLGLMAIRAIMPTAQTERLAFAGAVVTWAGAGLVLPYYGAEDFGLHAIAGPKGNSANLLGLIDAVRNQPVALSTFGIGLVSLAVGAIVMAIAVWRSGVLPRVSALLFAAGFALFLPQFYAPTAVRIGHGALVAVGLIALAVPLWRREGR